MMRRKLLKPTTAEEVRLSETPEGMRTLLSKHRLEDPMVYALYQMAAARHLGILDTMTVVAYHAVIRYEEMLNRMINRMIDNDTLSAKPLFFPRDDREVIE
jgi:hypothetical protein